MSFPISISSQVKPHCAPRIRAPYQAVHTPKRQRRMAKYNMHLTTVCIEKMEEIETTAEKLTKKMEVIKKTVEDLAEYECWVCMDIYSLENGVIACDAHFMCNDCVVRGFTYAVASWDCFPVSCCENRPLGVCLVEHLLDPKLVIKYKGKEKERYVPQAQLVYCSNCGKWHPPSYFYDTQLFSLTKCSCGTITCVGCKAKWQDDNHVCSATNNSHEKPEWMPEYSSHCRIKQYPACRLWIELREACNHMTCEHCRYEFCFVCKMKWSGNHHDCPIYGDSEEGYDEEGYELNSRGLHVHSGLDRRGLNRLGELPVDQQFSNLAYNPSEDDGYNYDNGYGEYDDGGNYDHGDWNQDDLNQVDQNQNNWNRFNWNQNDDNEDDVDQNYNTDDEREEVIEPQDEPNPEHTDHPVEQQDDIIYGQHERNAHAAILEQVDQALLGEEVPEDAEHRPNAQLEHHNNGGEATSHGEEGHPEAALDRADDPTGIAPTVHVAAAVPVLRRSSPSARLARPVEHHDLIFLRLDCTHTWITHGDSQWCAICSYDMPYYYRECTKCKIRVCDYCTYNFLSRAEYYKPGFQSMVVVIQWAEGDNPRAVKQCIRANEGDNALVCMAYLYEGYPRDRYELTPLYTSPMPVQNMDWEVVKVVVEYNVGLKGCTMPFRLTSFYGPLTWGEAQEHEYKSMSEEEEDGVEGD